MGRKSGQKGRGGRSVKDAADAGTHQPKDHQGDDEESVVRTAAALAVAVLVGAVLLNRNAADAVAEPMPARPQPHPEFNDDGSAFKRHVAINCSICGSAVYVSSDITCTNTRQLRMLPVALRYSCRARYDPSTVLVLFFPL